MVLPPVSGTGWLVHVEPGFSYLATQARVEIPLYLRCIEGVRETSHCDLVTDLY